MYSLILCYELCNKLRNLEIKGKKYTSNWHQNMELLTEAIEIETKYRKQIDLTNILTTDATIIRNPFNKIKEVFYDIL